jgi:hypothetical protein
MKRRRLRHIWLIIIGRVPYCFSTERMEFQMSLDNFNASVANLNNAADRLIAKASTDEAALIHAQADLAAADATATAALQPVLDKVNAAAPTV